MATFKQLYLNILSLLISPKKQTTFMRKWRFVQIRSKRIEVLCANLRN
ncbi:hypothetical protein BVRB_6g135640 [Beta vulgaris subsp. vulgaris]|nr:hypothetical protein BVRB_6g135640 [Beta vulgaris subsp. vulgaris]